MAVANTACLLARRIDSAAASSVVVIDWDLEAPGLHRFFLPYLSPEAEARLDETPGCIDLFMELQEALPEHDRTDFAENRRHSREALEKIGIEPFLLDTPIPGLT